jgi:hypothetical protein
MHAELKEHGERGISPNDLIMWIGQIVRCRLQKTRILKEALLNPKFSIISSTIMFEQKSI